MRDLAHHAHPRRQFLVQAETGELDGVRPVERDVEGREWRVPDGGQRLVLVLVVPEEVQLVAHDRSANRGAVLLVLVRQHYAQDGIRLVPAAVAEVADKRSGE